MPQNFASRCLVFAALATSGITADAEPSIRQLLTGSRWQYGLYGSARGLPVGLAFKQGITATVLSLNEDGSMRMDIPCRNEEFLRKVGGEFHLGGTWELKDQDTLVLTLVFRGESRTETISVAADGDELVFSSAGSQKRLGRFSADVASPCTYE